MKRPTSVVVIGAGLGGMSAAIMMAKAGMRVTILEKNERLGGKLNLLETEGFRFDLGPSIFTLPQVFRPLFDSEGTASGRLHSSSPCRSAVAQLL